MTMIARFPSTCPRCQAPIVAGADQIDRDRASGRFAHAGCLVGQAPAPAAPHRPVVAGSAAPRTPTPVTSAMARRAALPPAPLPGVAEATRAAQTELPTGTTYVAVDGGLNVGSLFMWSGSGQTDREALRASLEEVGFGELAPQAATVEAILRRTLARCKKALPGRTFVSAVERGSQWAVVQELRDRDAATGQVRLRHRVLLHATLGRRVDDLPGSEISFSNVADVEVSGDLDWLLLAIRADHQASLGNLSVDDVTSWLQDVLSGKLGAVQTMVGCRQYFVPAERVEEARRLARARKRASRYEVFEIPAMRAEEATQAILAALEREVVAAAEDIQAELEVKVEEMLVAEGKNGMTRRATTLQARLDRVDQINKKLASYAEKFGRPAQAAADQVQRLKRNLFLGLQYAEGRAEGRDMLAPRLLDLSDAPEAGPGNTVSDGAEARFAGIADEFGQDDEARMEAQHAADPDLDDPGRRFDLD